MHCFDDPHEVVFTVSQQSDHADHQPAVLDHLLPRILPLLPGASAVSHLVHVDGVWIDQDRWVDTPSAFVEVAPSLPEASVLDYAASRRTPTYLPQGEEGSEWCLAGARCALFLPLQQQSPSLLYIVGETVDAFSVEGIRQAYEVCRNAL